MLCIPIYFSFNLQSSTISSNPSHIISCTYYTVLLCLLINKYLEFKLYTIRIFNVYKKRSRLNSLMAEISVLSFMNNTYIAYADNSQFNSKLDKVSTWTCWAKGSLLFKLWYRLETSISSLETLTSVCGSSVFRPFSLNASIIFQISTECTVKK